jgi:hypothetical protein
VAKSEEDNKRKGIASSSNQKCEFYKTFNIKIIGLENETKFFPGSAISCYRCWGNDCRDPYIGNQAHIRTCPLWLGYCGKAALDTGKWLHS